MRRRRAPKKTPSRPGGGRQPIDIRAWSRNPQREEESAAKRTHYDSDQRQGSWRTIDTARHNPGPALGHIRREALSGCGPYRDRDYRREDPREERMQRAAVAAQEVATIAVVMTRPASIPMIVAMMMCAMRRRGVELHRLVGAWRRYDDSSQLRGQEQGRKQAGK